MNRKFFFFFLLLVGFFTTSFTHTQAAPNASLNLTPDKKYVNLSFLDLKSVAKVGYTLTYENNNRTTGVEGSFKTSPGSTRSTRRQLIGTCSTKRCVYHTKAKNFNLQVTYYLRAGGTKTITKSL